MDFEERRIADLTVRIDRLICVGFETCVDLAPDLFRMDAEGIATFTDRSHTVAREHVLEACHACPVDALQVFDASGVQLVP